MNHRKFTGTEKWCAKCKSWKQHSAFSKNSARVSGLNVYCNDCMKLRWKENKCPSQKPENKRVYDRQRRYGLSNEQFLSMWEEQNGLCAVVGCGKPIQDVDHDHKTNQVRALLCHACNRTLGLFQDNVIVIRNLAMYLEKFEKI
jgi:hypothetical protein